MGSTNGAPASAMEALHRGQAAHGEDGHAAQGPGPRRPIGPVEVVDPKQPQTHLGKSMDGSFLADFFRRGGKLGGWNNLERTKKKKKRTQWWCFGLSWSTSNHKQMATKRNQIRRSISKKQHRYKLCLCNTFKVKSNNESWFVVLARFGRKTHRTWCDLLLIQRKTPSGNPGAVRKRNSLCQQSYLNVPNVKRPLDVGFAHGVMRQECHVPSGIQ